jgi:hypothetical protein
MKAKRNLIHICLLCAAMLPAVVQAQFTYVTNNGTITITGYTGSGGAVTIPDTTNGLPVTSIGDWAFLNCTSLTSVTIGNSVTSIGSEAFQYCYSLTSLTIGTNVTSIGDNAFWDCHSLTSVTIPNSVTSIGHAAFVDCTSLTNVTIGNSVTSIGDQAFSDCFNLTSVTIPNSVTSIGNYAFGECTSLTAITVDTNNLAYSSVDGVLFNKSQTTLIECPGGKAGSYTIPDSVTSIGDSAFGDCHSLTNVTIPNSVTNIGDFAFGECYSLTSVYFQGNAPSVGSEVFYDANNATVYYLPGTTGWENFVQLTGLPTVLWNPQVQTSDASFGVRTNQFGFNITSTNNLVIVVEACSNLANPIWFPVGTNTLTGGSSYFSDPQWTNYPTRFYRFRSP